MPVPVGYPMEVSPDEMKFIQAIASDLREFQRLHGPHIKELKRDYVVHMDDILKGYRVKVSILEIPHGQFPSDFEPGEMIEGPRGEKTVTEIDLTAESHKIQSAISTTRKLPMGWADIGETSECERGV